MDRFSAHKERQENFVEVDLVVSQNFLARSDSSLARVPLEILPLTDIEVTRAYVDKRGVYCLHHH